MSETQTPETPVDIPNYAVTSAPSYTINGVSYKAFRVAFGEPVRSALVRELDEADQWDLSEIGGSNAENISWLSRAMAAVALIEVDGSPAICADAYNLLADEAKTPEEARDLYIRGVEAGQLALGPHGFEEFDGHFWGFLETRPYMRARHGLAMTLLQLGEEDAALEHFRAMLKLNPNDNQGIRYLLLAGLLRRGDLAGAKTLLASYADEWSANWLYTKALIAFREDAGDKPATLNLLKDAHP